MLDRLEALIVQSLGALPEPSILMSRTIDWRDCELSPTEKLLTVAGHTRLNILSARSVTWLSCSLWKRKIVSSNLTVPTILVKTKVRFLPLSVERSVVGGHVAIHFLGC